jgi:hypothetical protein
MEKNFKYHVFSSSIFKDDFTTKLNEILNMDGVIDFHSYQQINFCFEFIFKVEKSFVEVEEIEEVEED